MVAVRKEGEDSGGEEGRIVGEWRGGEEGRGMAVRWGMRVKEGSQG